jgi:hypothetical protein
METIDKKFVQSALKNIFPAIAHTQ